LTSKVALFLALPALASSQAALTSWTRSADPGSGMVARDIVVTRSDWLKEAAAAIHALTKTQKISSDRTNLSITVEGNAREAGLAEWLVGELDNPSPGPYGHGYIMPQDADDVTLVIGGVRVGAPIPAGAARAATLAELQEMGNAIRVLCDIARTEVYPPTSALAWRGKGWQNDFALWLLRELESPPAVNWTAPISYRLSQTSPSVRIFFFAPETTIEELRQIVNAIRSKAAQRVVVISAERAIALRGTDIEAAAAERIVAAAMR